MKCALVLLPLSVLTCSAQEPVFAPQPHALLTASAAGPLLPLEPLRDMRCAWGDFSGDGLLDVVVSGAGAAGPVTKLFENVSNQPGPRTVHLS